MEVPSDCETRDLPPVTILVRVHRAIVAEAAHELIVGRSYRSEAVVVLIGDGGSVYFEVVRALSRTVAHLQDASQGLSWRDGASEKIGACE